MIVASEKRRRRRRKKCCYRTDLKWLYYYGWVDRLHALMASFRGKTGLSHITSSQMEKDITEIALEINTKFVSVCVHLSNEKIMSRVGIYWEWK